MAAKKQTERKKSEEYRRLATVLLDSNDAVTVQEFDGRITAWNSGAERMYGYSGTEAAMMNVRDLVPDDRRGVALEIVQRIARGEEVRSFETQRLTKDGRTLDVWLTVTRLNDEAGNPSAVATTERDVTQRKQAEEALRESEARLRALVNTAADAIITAGEDGIIASFNPAAERMFGYAAEEAIGQNLRILMPSPYRQEHDGYITHYLETGERKIIGIGREVVGRRKDDSTFPIDLAVSELRHSGQRLFTGIIRDISERKALQTQMLKIAEAEQRRIGQDLHDGTQQELVGLSMIAQHLVESLQRLAEGAEGKAPQLFEEAGVLKLSKIAARLAEGLGEALGSVRLLARGLVPVEVDARGVMSALAELASRNRQLHHIACDFQCDEPVEMDDNFAATHLYRIAQEAVTNALKHAGADRIQISLHRTDDVLTLSILDNGVGIDDQRDASKGMGLPIMAYRASRLGATLSVGRGKQGGTLVNCQLYGR